MRANYSNPPTHGSQVVATVLGTPNLRSLWDRELGAMRDRMKAMRKLLVEKIKTARPVRRLQLRAESARHVLLLGPQQGSRCGACARKTRIYTIDTGRICIAALTTGNVDYVADAIAKRHQVVGLG